MLLIPRLLFFFASLLTLNLFSVDFHDFDFYQGKLTEEEVALKIQKYLEKDESIKSFYRLTPDALYIGDLDQQGQDYILKLSSISSNIPQKKFKGNGLKNVKIAIDPGHFGGELAEIEERRIDIPAEKTRNNKRICFSEGDLTYLTARALQKLLESEGAEVMITRPGLGRGCIDLSFFEWIQNHDSLKGKASSLSKLFRDEYNKLDLIARAEKINAFSPDLTLVIHYNAHLTDEEKEKKAVLTECNYNLAFIPGAFGKNELNRLRDRYEFLRLIVSDDIEESLKLSSHIVNQLVANLNTPLIDENEKTSYTKASCLLQDQGIYSRNLALTRLVHGPVCYGETLVQNNVEEVYRLSSHEITIGGVPCSKRIQQVAEGYFEGIKEYLNEAP